MFSTRDTSLQYSNVFSVVQCAEMDEEESTERQMQIAMLCQRLAKMKKLYNDGKRDATL